MIAGYVCRMLHDILQEIRSFALSSGGRPLAAAAACLALSLATPASAALAVGDQAPGFSTRGALGGTIMTIDLAELLGKGPVVLYFFPAAFSGGCPAETAEYSDVIDKFRAAGATVVGLLDEPVDTLVRYSTEGCGSNFPLASAGPRIVSGFDVDSGAFASSTTYVIAPTGKVAFVHANEDYSHVGRILAFVQGMRK